MVLCWYVTCLLSTYSDDCQLMLNRIYKETKHFCQEEGGASGDSNEYINRHSNKGQRQL